MLGSRSLPARAGVVAALGFGSLGLDALAAQTPHWAFVAPVRPAVPSIAAGAPSAWREGGHPVDAFVWRRLRVAGLEPSPPADRVTLLRRVSLDLTGVLPTPADVDAFVADDRPDAYEHVVDRLLASPHFGERWGRHWLDVARYADSNGYSNDGLRTMWPWRDWVVRAFNEDVPFDRFLVEQTAGDLLPDATLDQRIATGFHRNTQINQEGGIDPEEFRIEAVKNRVDTTFTAVLGLTFGCAQCHDHKYDPFSIDEYYRAYAFFNGDDEPSIRVGDDAERATFEALSAQLRLLQREVRDYEKRVPRAQRKNDRGLAERRATIRALERRRPQLPSTLVLAARAQPRTSHVHVAGDFTAKGAVVTPGLPAVLPALVARDGDGTPDRLDLARWLVDARNPLTARVAVNRFWQRLFGLGLVATENDFGTQGERPSHPELLDWLAIEFVARSWSVKSILRTVVTSATYRQASRARPDAFERDGRNRLLARQNRVRLDAEIVRDVGLVASGLLDPRLGGPPVFPPQPDGVMDLGQTKRPWRVSRGGDRYRRGLYTHRWRLTLHPALDVFDAPAALETCTRRNRSNTPLQSLTLLNDAAFFEFAQAFGARVVRDVPGTGVDVDAARVRLAFRILFGRSPAPAEAERVGFLLATSRLDLVDDATAAAALTADGPALARVGRPDGVPAAELAAWILVARVLLNLDEAVTRG